MIDNQAVRAHLAYRQDITHMQRETLREKHYRTGDPAERADLVVALADNRTDQDDLRIAYAIANGWSPAELDRNGFHLGYAWVDVTPTIGEQAIAYATDDQLVHAGYRDRIA